MEDIFGHCRQGHSQIKMFWYIKMELKLKCRKIGGKTWVVIVWYWYCLIICHCDNCDLDNCKMIDHDDSDCSDGNEWKFWKSSSLLAIINQWGCDSATCQFRTAKYFTRSTVSDKTPLNVTCCCSGFNVTNAILHLSAHNGSFGGPAVCPFCES